MPSNEDIGKLAEMVAGVLNGDATSAASLTKYAKTTSVLAQIYIEDSIISEDIAPTLMATLNQIYISFVMTALQLNNAMENYTVIRKAVQSVATEGFIDACEAIEEMFGEEDAVVSTEARKIEIDKNVSHLATGNLIEFDFIVAQDDKGKPVTVTVPIHVSLIPTSITKNVAAAFLGLNFTPSAGRRWKQVKAGEISLFRDFILSRDLVSKYAKAMREDKTNALKDMIAGKNRSRSKQLKDLLQKNKSNNVASSVLVFEKDTFDRAAHDASLDFSIYADRQKFFDAALAMLVVVVDTDYDQVDIYYNGLKQVMSLPFSTITKAGGGSGIDLKSFMSELAKGTPKF